MDQTAWAGCGAEGAFKMSRGGSRTRCAFARALRLFVLVALTAAMVPVAAPAAGALPATYWVDIVNGADTNPGTEAEPFKTITYAVSVALSADTIMVKPGTYSEANGETLQIVLSGETLISTGGSAVTIIDGEDANQLLVINGWGSGDRLEGFTFRHGGTGIYTAVTVSLNSVASAESQPLITNNVFSSNNVGTGGALAVSSPSVGVATALKVETNAFENNHATTGGAIRYDGYGSIDIVQNTFSGNTAMSGGAVALITYDATSTIEANYFAGNGASGGSAAGGAVYWNGHGSALKHPIVANMFEFNTAATAGGAIYLDHIWVAVNKNKAEGNTAPFGGFAYFEGGRATAENNYLTAHSASINGVVWNLDSTSSLDERNDTIYAQTSGPEAARLLPGEYAWMNITNCIYWNPALSVEMVNATSASYSCSRDDAASLAANGNAVGAGMVYADPAFGSMGAPYLDLPSPCIDAGNLADYAADDLEDTVRPLDGDANGSAIPDIGAHEYVNPNHAPVAVDDSYDATEDTPKIVAEPGVLGNDTDADADMLTVTGNSVPAHGTASVVADGSFTYTPAADYHGVDTFTYTVSDGNGGTDTGAVTITVVAANDAPVLAPIGDKSVDELSLLTFTATADDIDLPADTLVFSLETPPAGAEITSEGVFTWTPDEAQGPGTYPVTVVVSDGTTTDSETINVAVAEVNAAPVLIPIGNKGVNELSLLTFTATATDVDLPADTLTFSLVTPPAGAAITSAGVFTWMPTEAQGPGSYPVTIVVSDGTTTDSETITVTVAEVDEDLVVTPVAGIGRVETAIEASVLGFPSSEYVVIATARAFPDALGGSALAGALGAPILLTEPGVLSDAVSAEIARLGATHVIVLGGTGAVSEGVYAALDALPGVTSIERLFGANRYATAEAIASRTITEMGAAWDGTAFVATGESFPDALGASPIAAAKGWPIYLVHPNPSNHDALVATMDADGVTSALILGGTGVVPATLETKLDAAFGGAEVDRLFGANRYTTAVAVATYGVDTAGLAWNRTAIATGEDFPDALSGGALQGASGSVMLLAYPGYLHTEVGTALTAHNATISEVRFLGGIGAVPQIIRDAVVQALQ
ncbi:MAG: cell wall-binding repeat-containing protein [Coriobacteriia bacterium]